MAFVAVAIFADAASGSAVKISWGQEGLPNLRPGFFVRNTNSSLCWAITWSYSASGCNGIRTADCGSDAVRPWYVSTEELAEPSFKSPRFDRYSTLAAYPANGNTMGFYLQSNNNNIAVRIAHQARHDGETHK